MLCIFLLFFAPLGKSSSGPVIVACPKTLCSTGRDTWEVWVQLPTQPKSQAQRRESLIPAMEGAAYSYLTIETHPKVISGVHEMESELDSFRHQILCSESQLQ